jgi:membrane-associated phospholipid phosphatase
LAAACGLALVLAGGIPAVADDDLSAPRTITPPPEQEPRRSEGDGRRTLRRLPANVGHGFLGVFSQDNLGPAVLGGAAAAVSSVWDDEVRSSVKPGQLNWSSSLETAGGPIYSTVFVVGMFAGGRFAHGRFRAATYDMLEASLVNLGYTEALKVAVGRERPNQQDNKSFPSGHTSNAFALAAVAERHYGWKLGVPAYLLAGLVGASRLNEDKHWLSDVMAGATLGYVVGRTVVRVNSRALDHGAATTTLTVTPILGRRARGVQMSLSF